MSTTIITENNYFEKVENPIKVTTLQLFEIVKPVTKSTSTNLYYVVDEQLSKQKKGRKQLKKLVNAPNTFLNHDYQNKVRNKTENENFESYELKGRSVVSSSTLISDKTQEYIFRGIFEHKMTAGTPKVKTYIYNGEPTENLKFGQELSSAEAVANDLWTPKFYEPTEKITIGRGSVEKSEDCSFIQPYFSRIKFLKIFGQWYENIECEM
jgi:hypothetical protein